MLIYTTTNTIRFNYTVRALWAAFNSDDIIITQDKSELSNYSGAKINYSSNKITETELWIEPHGLLNEIGIVEQNIKISSWKNLPIFFNTSGDIPFDFFSASFFLLTRYEEYLPHQKDGYGRYDHTNSIAFKHNFLQLPLINLWVMEVIDLLTLHTKTSTFNPSPFYYIPTYDIDIAYSYKNHNILINTVGFFRDFVKANFDAVADRLNVYANTQKDPFDIYDWLNLLHRKYQLKPIYFFLLANKRVGYDKNVSPNSTAMQKLVHQHAQLYSVGIHPSWQSGDNEKLLQQEITTINKITQQNVIDSRQHYIRMSLPETYRSLISNQIQNDYSMGYGSINGFRASFTLPFKWYDLEKEAISNLTIHPFCYMEANSFFEQKLTIDEAATELQNYFNIVKKVNGQFITIFHNHFLTNQPQWVAWRNMYENFLQTNF